VALGTVAIAGVTAGGGIGRALPNFASGGSIMLTSFGIPTQYGAPFMALVLVSFLLTSTDTAVRLGRYMAEEIVGTPDATSDTIGAVQSVGTNRYSNAVIQCLIAYALVASGSWASLWPLFGGANQLLAALALLTATVWLANWDSDKQLVSTGVPMALMTVVTICALLYLALYQNLYQQFVLGGFAESAGLVARLSVGVQILLALVLVGLALSLVGIGYRNIRDVREEPAGVPADD